MIFKDFKWCVSAKGRINLIMRSWTNSKNGKVFREICLWHFHYSRSLSRCTLKPLYKFVSYNIAKFILNFTEISILFWYQFSWYNLIYKHCFIQSLVRWNDKFAWYSVRNNYIENYVETIIYFNPTVKYEKLTSYCNGT